MELALGGRDPNFVCAGCLGDIVVVGEKEGRKDYDCKKCGNNRMRECTICHMPRSIWADNGDICSGCGLKAYSGQIFLSGEQWKGMKEWQIIVPLKPNA